MKRCWVAVRNARLLVVSASVGCMLVALAHCGHGSQASRQARREAAYPAWVRQGSSPLLEQQTRLLVGVGHVSGMRNVTLARSTADNRARAELVNVFERFAVALMEAFEADVSRQKETGHDVLQPADLLTQDQAIKVLSAASLGGVQITQHWFYAADNAVYALARLELDHVVDGILRVRELSSPLRDWLQHHTATIFDAFLAQNMQEQAQRRDEKP